MGGRLREVQLYNHIHGNFGSSIKKADHSLKDYLQYVHSTAGIIVLKGVRNGQVSPVTSLKLAPLS